MGTSWSVALSNWIAYLLVEAKFEGPIYDNTKIQKKYAFLYLRFTFWELEIAVRTERKEAMEDL